jgi:hypothetical protein
MELSMTDATIPITSLSMLLDGLIDYAGLYPPASLPMPEMVAGWARGLDSDFNWMLGRLIVPVSRLDEFEAAASGLFPSGCDEDPWVISALISSGDDAPLQSQIDRILKFNDVHCHGGQGDAIIDVVELRGSSPHVIESALDVLPEEVFPFFELELDGDVRGKLASLVGSDAGAKIRTGGIRPDLYPNTASLADFIIQCARADVPFKATAGLHHPLRNHNDAIDAMQFGFLNVFLAAILAVNGEATPDDLGPLLTRCDLTGIEFLPDGISIDGKRHGLAEIEDVRIAFALSFGSCSFEEPVQDLITLGLLSH